MNGQLPLTPSPISYPFLNGGGELGHLTRVHNWSQTTLGPPDQWPLSLRTTVGIVLHSATPIFLYWGNESLCFYNDAFRPSLGANGKHPALGKPAKEVWPEVWDFVGPLIEQVSTTGEPVFFENQLLLIQRNGRIEATYWTFSYSPAYGDEGQIDGILVICTETTEKVASLKREQENSKLLRAVFDSSSAGISVISAVRDEQGQIIDFEYDLVNRVTEQLNNRTDLVGKRYSAIHPAYKELGIFDDFVAVVNSGQAIERERNYTGEGYDNWYETIVVKLDDGVVFSFRDITSMVQARQKVEDSERYYRQLTDTVPTIIWETRPDGHCTYLNQQWYDLTGQTPAEAEGDGWLAPIYPDDKAESGRLFLEANQNQTAFNIVYRLRHKNGAYRWAINKANPRFGTDGTYQGMIGTVVDIHDRQLAEKNLRTSEAKLRSLIAAAPFPIGLYVGREMRIELANQTLIDVWGKGNDVIGKVYAEVLPELDNQAVFDQLDGVYTTGIPFHATNQRIDLMIEGKQKSFYFNYSFTPVFDAAGQVYGVLNTGVDTTEQVYAQQQVAESEARFQNLVRQANVGIVVLIGEEIRVEIVNDAYAQLIDRSCEDLLGKPLFSIVPEAELPFRALLDNVRNTGETLYLDETPYFVWVNGVKKEGFVSVIYQPYREHDGAITGVVALCQDVTGQVLARQELAQQKSYLQNALDIADLGTFRVDTGNNVGTYTDNIRQWFGLASLEQPMDNIISKVHPDDQKMVAQILEASNQGKGQDRHDITYRLADAHSNTTRYLRSIGKAQRADGKPYTIDGIIQDVTPQVLALQKIEEAEATLRGAVELAELGTWELNAVTGIGTYSDRIKSWFGYKANTNEMNSTLYNPVIERDRNRVETAIGAALQPGSSGIYDEEYTVIHQQTGRERIIHAQGKTYFDPQGLAIKISGTAQDVTQQRNLQHELEQQVQQRTHQLQASVQDLKRSNENLQQFAYVASHDLQEPLRKIQSFSDMLKSQYADQLGDGVDYLSRMQNSAQRMSTLIRDLLTYSRITTRQDATAPVSLDAVVNAVLADLELTIQETNAVVTVDPLPTVPGDRSQLGQLFQNLLSNALKFRRAGVATRISVSTRQIPAAALPPAVRPTRVAEAYYQIDVADNGIGFDEKYLDRIFQVFQRLHGKNEFAGTGIGLAICEKVATNHGGAITASSQPGLGATFSVYFPV